MKYDVYEQLKPIHRGDQFEANLKYCFSISANSGSDAIDIAKTKGIKWPLVEATELPLDWDLPNFNTVR